MSAWVWLITAILFSLQWIGIRLSGVHLSPQWEVVGAGLAIFGAAFILSWAAEVAQVDIPQALALAFLLTLEGRLKRKRALGHKVVVDPTDAKRVARSLPYA